MTLQNLPAIVEEYICGEQNMGTPKEAIQVKLSPVEYPNLPTDKIDDMINRGVCANREKIASSVWVELCALAPYSGHETGIRICAVDEGLTSRGELVRKIIETIAPYEINVQRQDL